MGDDASFELHTLSFVSFSANEFARARRYAGESLTGFERLGLRGAIAMCQAHLAVYALAAGDTRAARDAARQSLVLARSTNLTAFMFIALRCLASVAAQGGDAAKAARLLGAGHLKEVALGWTRELQEHLRCEETLETIRLALGCNEDGLAALMAEGHKWAPERAIEEALAV